MIDITPFSASIPYASLDAVDFETDIDSISFGSSELNLILLIFPLITMAVFKYTNDLSELFLNLTT